MNAIEQSKRLAAYNAVDHHVRPEHKVSYFYDNFGVLILSSISGHWNRFWCE